MSPPITIYQVAVAEGAVAAPDGSINGHEFMRLNLPIYCGCEACGASLSPANSYPSRTGNIRCEQCIDELGFETIADFQQFEANNNGANE